MLIKELLNMRIPVIPIVFIFQPKAKYKLQWFMPMLHENSTMKLDCIECAIGIIAVLLLKKKKK